MRDGCLRLRVGRANCPTTVRTGLFFEKPQIPVLWFVFPFYPSSFSSAPPIRFLPHCVVSSTLFYLLAFISVYQRSVSFEHDLRVFREQFQQMLPQPLDGLFDIFG